VEELAQAKGVRLDFDVPFPDIGFEGVPFRAKVYLQPTTHCLINVVEWVRASA
jgi:nucleosome binding factor SPN SPT16 subunit